MKVRVAIITFASTVLFCASCLQAQQPAQPSEQLHASVIPYAEVNDANWTAAATPATGEPSAAAVDFAGTAGSSGSSGAGGGQGGGAALSTDNDDRWHFSVSPYLWLPGVHGTIGAGGYAVGYKASASDLLSHADFALLGLAEARRNRVIANIDTMWMRLSDNKAIPFPPGADFTSADIHFNMFILTPKVGFRLLNQEKLKADFLTGFRYWHFGENATFSPFLENANFNRSQNWVDPLVGGRIIGALSPKAEVTIAGDVGGWGTGSQLEYQVVGLLGYRLTPKMILQAGYRYMYFDYQKINGNVNPYINNAMSGVLLGVTLNLK
jgi:hypothetical protein